MECSVCYGESGPFRKLSCGHEFCCACIKTWYLKGTGTGCPMCRRPVYFRGFHAVRKEWDQQAYETRCADALSENIDMFVHEAFEALRTDCDELSKEESLEDAYYLSCDMVEEVVDDLRDFVKYMDDADECETTQELLEFYKNWILNDIKNEVVKMEKTYRYLKSHNVDSETIDEALYYMEEYYSDKDINKWVWFDEPLKELMPRYPKQTKAHARGKRVRAREDPWVKVSLIFIL